MNPQEVKKAVAGLSDEELAQLASRAQKAQADFAAGMGTRMPSWEWFDRTSFEYQAAVLREDLPAVSVEAGATLGWERYADMPIGIDEFGTSAPVDQAFDFFGFVPGTVEAAVREVLGA